MTWANRTAFILIIAVIIFTTLAYGAVHQPVIALFYVMVAVIVVMWAIDGYKSGAVRFSTSAFQVPVLLLAFYGAVQCIPFGSLAETAGIGGIPRTLSLDPFATQMTAIHLAALFIFLAVTLVLVDSSARIRRLAWVITFFGFIYAFYAILQSFLSPTSIYGIYDRPLANPFGSFVNRHNFAAFIVMCMSLPMGLLFTGAITKDKRLLYITAVTIMGIALLLSGSRGGLVALAAGVSVLVILTVHGRGRKVMALRAGAAVLFFAALVAGAVFVGGESSLTRFAESAASEDFTSNRIHIWRVTLDVIASNLPFGAGLGAFASAYTAFDTLSGLERVEQAHNDYLQVLADAGVVGLALGAAFLFFLFRSGVRNSKVDNLYRQGIAIGAFAGCVAILVHSLFDFVLHTTAVALMFLTLLALLEVSGFSYIDDLANSTAPGKRSRKAEITPISSGRRKLKR